MRQRSPDPSEPDQRRIKSRALVPLFASMVITLAPSGRCYPETSPSPVAPSTGAIVSCHWLEAWVQYPPETLRAEDTLPPEPRLDVLRITAARGEKEPFTMIVRSPISMSGVGPIIGDLKADSGQTIPASRVSIRRMACVVVDVPSGGGSATAPFAGRTGSCPDILTNQAQGWLRPHQNTAFWITVDVPPDSAPGIYRGELKLEFRCPEWIRKAIGEPRTPVELRVYRFALPRPSPLKNITYMGIEKLPDDWLEPERVRRLCQLAAEIRSAPDPVLPPPALRILEGGKIELDASAWEKTATYCLDELKAPMLLLPVWPIWSESKKDQGPLQGLYFLWHFPAVARQRWPARSPVFIADDSGHLTPEFKTAFGAYLRRMNEIVCRHDWTNRVFVTTMDEPYTYHTDGELRKSDTPENNYRVVGEVCDLVRTAAPAIKTFVTADPTPELVGRIDYWCLRTFGDAGRIRERLAAGDTVTFIDNYRAVIDYPLVSSRTFGWLAWHVGAAGWINSESLASIDRAWEGAVFGPSIPKAPIWWGAMNLFYPDPFDRSLLPSVRWEMMREGCDDYEYLWLLRQAATNFAPGSPEQKEAAEILDAANRMAPPPPTGQTNSNAASLPPTAQHNAMVWDLRCRIAELLDKPRD